LRYLDGQFPGYSRRPEYEDVLACRELCTKAKRKPGRHTGIRQSSGRFIIHAFRNGKRECPGYDRALRHRAVRRSSSTEKHAPPVIEVANSIRAADARKLTRTGIVRAAGQLLVNRFQRCGLNMYNLLAVACDGLGELLAAGRSPRRVQDGGIHPLLSSAPGHYQSD